ncbi:uncharacterized MFS-type transporter C09D4.1-like [Neodiprion pinetum]|uniref:uncharacterized MFS-type transporter C09D4.1-like n=1 Tax=Neodiprion pinetum TaxID=441929 RepID=UPI001EE1233B|nr:uncharacterized MFS-type transporter C09D4.1-like [Neodiprion pinetum]XP_046492203.1 uncharacterized MFS-type transporter C09D4.1-like [Neodiprion pinetum]
MVTAERNENIVEDRDLLSQRHRLVIKPVVSEFVEMQPDEKLSKIVGNATEIKVYPRRWLQLVLFIVFSTTNNLQWYQYTIINNIVSRYYNVSSLAIDWTSMIFMVTYMVVIFPASYVTDRVGLRWTVVFASTLTCIGAWLKVLSASPDRFMVTFTGQILVAVAQVFILPVPGRLAAYWFGPKQIALATAFACAGTHVGFSICFPTVPVLVKNHDNIEDIGKDLYKVFWGIALCCSVIVVAIIFLFKDEPLLPPSDARALQKLHKERSPEGFWPPVKRTLCNIDFILLWNSYGIIMSVLGATNTVLNSLCLAHFKNGEQIAGNLGLSIVGTGGFGTVFLAMILDKTKAFRIIPIAIGSLALLTEVLFAISFSLEVQWMVVVTGMMLGTFLVGWASLGFELCAETTYPEPVGTTVGILNISIQIYGTLMVLIVRRLIETYGDRAAHYCLSASLLIGTILIASTRGNFRRQNAERIAKYNPVALQEFPKPEKQ